MKKDFRHPKGKDSKNLHYLLKAIFPGNHIKDVDDPKTDPVNRMQKFLDKH